MFVFYKKFAKNTPFQKVIFDFLSHQIESPTDICKILNIRLTLYEKHASSENITSKEINVTDIRNIVKRKPIIYFVKGFYFLLLILKQSLNRYS